MKDTITIRVGDKVFPPTLLDNAAAKEFKTMLPLTINMTELNGNEKYFRFSKNFYPQMHPILEQLIRET